jgi:putative tricarboxylic transport membrane protein
VDDTYGAERFTFGVPLLADGIDYLIVMVGAYGLGEVFTRMERGFRSAPLESVGRARTRLPRLREVLAVKATFVRGSVLGLAIGIVPGAGATVASFLSYGAEAQYGKRRRQMGEGIPEGIVAPQAAATASVGGAMIPLMTMGIPGSGATAIILGAFLLHGLQPGPQVFQNSSHIVYAVFASVFVAVIGMCAIGYFAVRAMVRVLELPEVIISAYVVMCCILGAFAARNNITDVWLLVVFGVLGYTAERLRFPVPPLVLGTILGPLAESTFMTTMISFGNDWTVFFTRPVAGAIMALAFVTLLWSAVRQLRERRRIETET